MLSLDSSLRLSSINLQSAQQIDFAWMLSHYLNVPGTPMWVGFNSLLYDDIFPKQIICYLTTINASPTNNDVVYETMLQSKKVARECGQDYIEVTYDLAIAKIALQIQSTEKGLFDILFIHLGAFHIMMAFFKAVGKFIDYCGLSVIMVNAEMIANGSVNGFITGKHFNRCKRLHPMITLALKMIHFEKFIEQENIDLPVEFKTYLIQFSKQTRSSQPSIQQAEVKEIFEKYEKFKMQTLEGKHGKTAQYYMIYVKLIDYYLLLNKSIRTGNFEMYKFALSKIVNLYFTFNQPNYARYLVRYLDNLMKIDETHPGLRENFTKGSLGIKRTTKPFSKQAIDLTLEQTINADAANKLTGISHITNSISARQRWCRSHTIRSAIISHIVKETGLNKLQDVTADLQNSKIKKSTTQLHILIDCIKRNMNPFHNSLDKNCLYNISTGEAAPEAVENFLLNVEEDGDKERENFIESCINEPKNFDQAISKTKCHTFTEMITKKKVTVARKETELRMQRDLFGQLLHISLKKELDLHKVLAYPLTPVPLSLCHLDGSICKTQKSALMTLLEKYVNSKPLHTDPQYTNVMIFDGYFILNLLKDVPLTFGNISKKVLQMICASRATVIVIAFDRYIFPSIKDTEHKLRGMVQANYRIDGPDQVRKKEFSVELKNSNFKEALVQFFIDDWEADKMAPFINNKTIYVNADVCYKYTVSDGKVVRTEEQTLTCRAHEEADTKMIYHVCQLGFDANVTIRCSDIDVLIIMLANMDKISNNIHICIEVGVGNNKRLINVTQLYEALGKDTSATLPAFHALTGCDFNPAFFRKGKKRPFFIMTSSGNDFTNCFIQMSKPSENREELLGKIEEFVCHMYGFKRLKYVNEARTAMFQKTYKLLDKNDVFQLPKKSIDGSSLPPCKSELHQQFLRACFIAQIWSHAHLKVPTTHGPSDYGWEEVDDMYDFRWFSGNQLPSSITEITIQPEKGNIFENSIHIYYITYDINT
ncbi:hypothetical protein ALC62_05715 [Cyphomyrmex costatus]|uniref:Uncharacterized protein n=1 Tax=Cyphomyrmex costatus TaxID=456900 RepID=A0A151IJW7_9HYME|nr:hypothetical protein ALC62_05715 [Cyphomyrmex costatus]